MTLSFSRSKKPQYDLCILASVLNDRTKPKQQQRLQSNIRLNVISNVHRGRESRVLRPKLTNALELVHGVVPPLTRPAAVPHESAPGAPVLRVGGLAASTGPLDARGPDGRVWSPGGLEDGQARGGTAGRDRAPDRSRGRRASRWRRLVALLAVVAALPGALTVAVIHHRRHSPSSGYQRQRRQERVSKKGFPNSSLPSFLPFLVLVVAFVLAMASRGKWGGSDEIVGLTSMDGLVDGPRTE